MMRCGARADKLSRIGLSRPKIKTVKAISAAIAKGNIDLARLAGMEADSAHAALTALHGVGPWTADIYLLFCLGHADAWPAGDLGLLGDAHERRRFGCRQLFRGLDQPPRQLPGRGQRGCRLRRARRGDLGRR